MILQLPESLSNYNSCNFSACFKEELLSKGIKQLPLLQSMQYGSHPLPETVALMLLSQSEERDNIFITCALMFQSVIAGCNCSDDPSSGEQTYNEYAEIKVTINKNSSASSIKLISG